MLFLLFCLSFSLSITLSDNCIPFLLSRFVFLVELEILKASCLYMFEYADYLACMQCFVQLLLCFEASLLVLSKSDFYVYLNEFSSQYLFCLSIIDRE